VTAEVARAWGGLAAAVAQRGGKPRRRQVDLAIAATAIVEQVPLLSYDVADLRIVEDLVDAPTLSGALRREPARGHGKAQVG